MALVDTECFMIYYITIISLEFLTNQRQQKGKKKIKILFSLYIDKACLVTDKR